MLDLRVKALFFDARRVTDRVNAARRGVLSKAGAFVRQGAKTSIRKRKDPSPPGRPPSSHVGLLRSFIFFSFDQASDSVVIGPVPKRRAGGEVPNLLEFGGSIRTRRPRLVRVKSGRDSKGRFKKDRMVRVPAGTNMEYQPRPYMGPALKAEEPKLPRHWANSVKGA